MRATRFLPPGRWPHQGVEEPGERPAQRTVGEQVTHEDEERDGEQEDVAGCAHQVDGQLLAAECCQRVGEVGPREQDEGQGGADEEQDQHDDEGETKCLRRAWPVRGADQVRQCHDRDTDEHTDDRQRVTDHSSGSDQADQSPQQERHRERRCVQDRRYAGDGGDLTLHRQHRLRRGVALDHAQPEHRPDRHASRCLAHGLRQPPHHLGERDGVPRGVAHHASGEGQVDEEQLGRVHPPRQPVADVAPHDAGQDQHEQGCKQQPEQPFTEPLQHSGGG